MKLNHLPVKKTYICKDITEYSIMKELPENYLPKAGDVAVFEILKLGKHKNVQSESRRNMTIIPGDLMMATFGNRYATAQFEGYVPENLNGELHILGAGGIVGQVHSTHYDYLEVGPTYVKLVGLVTDHTGSIINTIQSKKGMIRKFSGDAARKTKVILSLGSSMDSGKSTSASYMVNGIKRAGYKVGFIKLTGTVFTKDSDLNADLGADSIADFSDFGYPSTYLCEQEELFDLYESLVDKVNAVNPDYIVMEIADGLYQRETLMYFKNKQFMSTVFGTIFSAGDSLSAIYGIGLLQKEGINPIALTGLFTASPLLIKEVKQNKLFDIPVVTVEEIAANTVALLKREYHPAFNQLKDLPLAV